MHIHLSRVSGAYVRFVLWSAVFSSVIACSYTPPSPELSHHDQLKPPMQRLKEGNLRFRESRPRHPDQSLERLHEIEIAQHPFAAVISCSDSRVPPELIFDQGLGDLFVIRNGGNIVADYELASVEYAVEYLQVQLVVILGHSHCGAIEAYLEHEHDTLHNHIQRIVDYIKAEHEEQQVPAAAANRLQRCIEANVWHGVHTVTNSAPTLSPLCQQNKLIVVGAMYDMHSGEVHWLDVPHYNDDINKDLHR